MGILCLCVTDTLFAQKDITSQYITNATLSNGTTGWTVTNFNAPQRGNNTVGWASESYAGWGSLEKTNYGLTQNITLPRGSYRLVNYSFFRQGLAYNTDANKSLAYLKAGNNQVAIKTLGSITANGYANSQAEGANCFDSKMYRNVVEFEVTSASQTLEIGITGTFDLKQSWVIVGMFELFDMNDLASVSSPTDVTYEITNSGFEYRDMTGWNVDGIAYQNNNWANKSGIGFAEKWQNNAGLPDASLTQNLTGLDNGLYELSVYAHNINQGNNNAACGGMFLEAGGSQTEIGAYGQYKVRATVTDGTLSVGIRLNGCTGNWIAFDRFGLAFYGDPLDAWRDLLAQAVARAEATQGTIPTAIYNNLNSVVTANNREWSTEAEYEAAIEAIDNATDAAIALQSISTRYQEVRAAVLALDDDATVFSGTATVSVTAADNAYNSATTEKDIEDAIDDLRSEASRFLGSVAVNDGKYFDITDIFLENADFSAAGVDFVMPTGWESDYRGGDQETNIGYQGASYTNDESGVTIDKFIEAWRSGNAAIGDGYLRQTAEGLPLGLYSLEADAIALNQGAAGTAVTGVYLYIESDGVDYKTSISTGNAAPQHFKTEFTSPGDVDIIFGLKTESTTANWIGADNFVVKFYGDQISQALIDEINAQIPSGIMNATVQTALNTAKSDFDDDTNFANYRALQAAIVNANASIAAYADAKAAIDAANAILANHNFATSTATTTFESAISAIETPYNNRTLEDAAARAAGTTLGVVPTGWHDGANGAAVKYIESGFGLNGFNADLYINTWSVEGETDGSGFKVPFFEYWTGDAETLADHVWTGTVSGLENGLYSVSASVRVRATNGVTPTDATGITLSVNDGTAVDVTEGTQVGESQFNLGAYEAEGLVKDGTLHVNFAVAGANISWLSFQNVKYTKVRDLTPEEAAIVPTAIALDQTSVTLTAAANTVTLTPSFTPTDATPTVTWTTSDAAVATVVDGVVTGVAPGTATITVTSSFDANVSATCVVTVSYPESSFATTTYINDGATRTIYTLSSNNLFKNGSFEYPNAVYGWKTIGYETDAVAGNFTVTTTGGVDDGTFITTNGAGVGSANTIRKSVPVEADKKYYFAVSTSGKAPAANNFQYNALFQMTDATTEDGVLKAFEWPQGAANTTTEWSKTEFVFTADAAHPYVGVRMGWNDAASFDNFVLVEVVDETVVGNVDYATANLPTVNVGTGAFQYNSASIAAAQTLVQDVATVAEVQAAYDAAHTINVPAEGTAYNFVLRYDGYAYDGKALTFKAGARTGQGDYNIEYHAAPAPYLAQAFTMTQVSGNQYKMSQRDEDGNERYICLGTVYGGNTAQIRTTTTAADAAVFEIIPDATRDGIFHIWNVAANQYVGSQDAGMYTVNSHVDFTVAQTQKVSVPVTVNADYDFSTLILPFDAPYPEGWPTSGSEGAGAYKVDGINNDGSIVLEREEDKFHANTPYIVYAPDGVSETYANWGAALQATYETDYLNGSYVARTAPAGAYVLSAKAYTTGTKVGFYRLQSDTQVPAHKAYFTIPAASPVKAEEAFFFSGFGDETAIGNVGLGDQKVEGIYNVNGVKTDRLLRGTNIIRMADGSVRKVIVK